MKTKINIIIMLSAAYMAFMTGMELTSTSNRVNTLFVGQDSAATAMQPLHFIDAADIFTVMQRPQEPALPPVSAYDEVFLSSDSGVTDPVATENYSDEVTFEADSANAYDLLDESAPENVTHAWGWLADDVMQLEAAAAPAAPNPWEKALQRRLQPDLDITDSLDPWADLFDVENPGSSDRFSQPDTLSDSLF